MTVVPTLLFLLSLSLYIVWSFFFPLYSVPSLSVLFSFLLFFLFQTVAAAAAAAAVTIATCYELGLAKRSLWVLVSSPFRLIYIYI